MLTICTSQVACPNDPRYIVWFDTSAFKSQKEAFHLQVQYKHAKNHRAEDALASFHIKPSDFNCKDDCKVLPKSLIGLDASEEPSLVDKFLDALPGGS